MLMNTGAEPVSTRGLLTTVAWKLDRDDARDRLRARRQRLHRRRAVQWLRDGLGIIGKASEIEALARQVPDSGGVTFVPALAGLGAPHWRPDARGLITGLTRGTTRPTSRARRSRGSRCRTSTCVSAMQADAGRRDQSACASTAAPRPTIC